MYSAKINSVWRKNKEKEPNTKFTDFLLDHVPKLWSSRRKIK